MRRIPATVSRIAGRFSGHVTEIGAFAGIMVLALALRLYQIGAENFWTDEWISLGDSRHLAEHNRHRPLFYLLLRVWLHFGRGDVWPRLLALLFGLGGIVVLYVLGRRLVGVAAALVACVIMAVAVPELDHSQEVRMYTMASTFTLASLYALVVWVEDRRIFWLVLYAGFAYLAFLTTPTVIFGVLLAGVMAGLLLWHRRERRSAMATFLAEGLAILFWLPLSRYARLAVQIGSLSWIPRPPRSALLLMHGQLLSDNFGGVRNAQPSFWFQIVFSVLVLALVANALVATDRGYSAARSSWVIAVWFYTIAIAMYATSVLITPVWFLRYFHCTAPALYLLVGVGLVSLLRWWRPAGLIAAAAVLALTAIAAWQYYLLPVREDWRGAANAIAPRATVNDVIGVIGLSSLFRHYYHGSGTVREISPQLTALPQKPTEVMTDLLGQIPRHRGQTWLVVREDPRFDRVAFLHTLEQHLRDCGTPPQIEIFRNIGNQIDVLKLEAQPQAQ